MIKAFGPKLILKYTMHGFMHDQKVQVYGHPILSKNGLAISIYTKDDVPVIPEVYEIIKKETDKLLYKSVSSYDQMLSELRYTLQDKVEELFLKNPDLQIIKHI